jgi:DNA-binding response OmpR family regulator
LKMARLLGADAILSKPFHRDELLKALDEVLRKQSLID